MILSAFVLLLQSNLLLSRLLSDFGMSSVCRTVQWKATIVRKGDVKPEVQIPPPLITGTLVSYLSRSLGFWQTSWNNQIYTSVLRPAVTARARSYSNQLHSSHSFHGVNMTKLNLIAATAVVCLMAAVAVAAADRSKCALSPSFLPAANQRLIYSQCSYWSMHRADLEASARDIAFNETCMDKMRDHIKREFQASVTYLAMVGFIALH